MCIIGKGLSGLATAFFIRRALPLARIRIVDGPAPPYTSANQDKGYIKTVVGKHGQVCELGFQSSILVNKSGREALGLVRELGLDDEVVSAEHVPSSRRHLLHNGKVQLFPSLLHMAQFLPPLVLEPLWSKAKADDESVHSFVQRRSSSSVADRIADPLCSGLFAGDSRLLSVRSCFPRLWYNEQRFRSVFIGSMFAVAAAHSKRSWLSLGLLDPLLQRVSTGGRSYSFRDGLGTLLQALEEKLDKPLPGKEHTVSWSGTVSHLQDIDGQATVVLTKGESFQADLVIAAIPPARLSHLLEPSTESIRSLHAGLQSFVEEDVSVVQLQFSTDVLKPRVGAGYFCPSDEPILACTWDSQLFQNRAAGGGSSVTFYVRGADDAEQKAMHAAREHLGVTAEPEEVRTKRWSVPQYHVGHRQLMRKLDAHRRKNLPWLHFAGPGYYGSRNGADEIVDARMLADSLAKRLARFPQLVENETEADTQERHAGGFHSG